jgi:hypothetical protein
MSSNQQKSIERICRDYLKARGCNIAIPDSLRTTIGIA